MGITGFYTGASSLITVPPRITNSRSVHDVRQIPPHNLESRGVNTRASTVSGVVADADISSLPWYRQVSRDQWRAFWAVFLGWIVDSFDFNILAFIVVDIQKSFTIDRALAGALGTVTLIMRLVGGTLAGTAADKWGRKLPLTLSILWFSLFAFLSGSFQGIG